MEKLEDTFSPILDRIDIHIEIKPVKYEDLKDNIKSKSSADFNKCNFSVRF